MRWRSVALLAGLTATVSPGWALERSLSIVETSVIESPEGEARILFRFEDLTAEEGTAIVRSAELALAISGQAVAREYELRIHPVTRAWSSPDWEGGWERAGGDFEDDLYSRARVDLTRGGQTVRFDLLSVMNRALGDEFMDGLILTVAPFDGVGIPEEDLPRFAALASAAIRVQYRWIGGRDVRL